MKDLSIILRSRIGNGFPLFSPPQDDAKVFHSAILVQSTGVSCKQTVVSSPEYKLIAEVPIGRNVSGKHTLSVRFNEFHPFACSALESMGLAAGRKPCANLRS